MENNNSKIISNFEINLSKSENLCLIDPTMLSCIIIIILIILFLMEYKLTD